MISAALLSSRGPLPHAEVVDLVLEALEGLAHVHAAGIVHRDLKPSNLFLARRPDGSNVVKVLDFGVSKSLVEPHDDRVKALTGNVVIGSPVYMSPEQVRNARSVDARSDIWSLAVAVYELVTGALPFDGEGVGEVLAQILDGQARPMRAHRPEVPPGLDAVIGRCFHRDRDQRPGDVAELARALAPFGSGSADRRIQRIESTLVNAPLSRAPTSLGSLHAIRTTQVERISDVIVPPGQPREASGNFALSRTFVDVSVPANTARSTRAVRLAWAGAAFAVLLVAGTGGYGVLRSAAAPARAQAAIAVAPLVLALPAAPAAFEPAASDSAAPAPAPPPREKDREPARARVPARRSAPGADRPAFLKSRK